MDPSDSPLLVIAFFVVIWVVVSFVISKVSGWANLAGNYSSPNPFEGRCWRFQSAQMRWMSNYNNCLTVGANQQGLYLSIFIIMRIGHPPLFIPWRDISVTRKKIFWFRMVELGIGRETRLPFRIREKLANLLREAAGKSWPTETEA